MALQWEVKTTINWPVPHKPTEFLFFSIITVWALGIRMHIQGKMGF